VTSTVFDAVAEPARRRLLDLLMIEGPLPVGELVARSGLSQPNTSRHLRVLRDAGLVECRAAGQRRVYAVRGEGFADLARWLAPYVRLWQSRGTRLTSILTEPSERSRRRRAESQSGPPVGEDPRAS
jgi:DNA-binding transcriptional ArsR family regulator